MYQYHFSFFTSPNLFHYLPLSNVIGFREVNGILQYNGSRRRTHLVYHIAWNGLLPRALTDIFYLLGDPDNNYCIISDWISIAATRHWLLENRNQQSNTHNIDNIDNKSKKFQCWIVCEYVYNKGHNNPFFVKPTPISDNRTYFCNIEIFVDPKYISFFTHIKRKLMLN